MTYLQSESCARATTESTLDGFTMALPIIGGVCALLAVFVPGIIALVVLAGAR